MINMDIQEFKNRELNSNRVNYQANELIQSYQNGISKGFISGLRVAVEFVNTINPALASELQAFAERCHNEQDKK
jgi:hypothetical protein